MNEIEVVCRNNCEDRVHIDVVMVPRTSSDEPPSRLPEVPKKVRSNLQLSEIFKVLLKFILCLELNLFRYYLLLGCHQSQIRL